MMSKKGTVLVILIAMVAVFAGVSQVSAAEKIWPPSYYLGTLRSYMDDIQKLPDVLNTAICEKNDEEYKEKYQLLVKRISDVEWLMEEMELKNTMNLQRVLTAFINNKECGVGKIATSYADTAREKLQLELDPSGLE